MSTNFDHLFVSYSSLKNNPHSWVDIIPIRELHESLLSGANCIIKTASLASLKFVKAECEIIEKTYATVDHKEKIKEVLLVFSDFGDNKKNDIEKGTLTLTWNKVSPLDESFNYLYRLPDEAAYIVEGSSAKERPNVSYLEHVENKPLYFHFVNYKGISTKRHEIFYVEEFERNKLLFSEVDYNDLYEYIKKEVSLLQEFSIGTRWPNPWPSQLDKLWEVLKDETKAAYFLSALVQKAVMEDKSEWVVSKVRLPGRERRTLYFYRTDKEKEE